MSNLSRRTFLASTAGVLASSACSTPTTRRQPVNAPSEFDRERFIEDVRRALPQGQGAVEEVIARAVSQPDSVIHELGSPEKTGIEVLHKDDDLSIFNIVWPPLAVLVPHDHLMWASIGVYAGREDNIVWRRVAHTIEATTATSVGVKDVFSLPANGIHSVVNPVESYTAALHVYGGDLTTAKRSQWDALLLQEAPFDLEEGRRILRQAESRFGSGEG